MKRFIALFIAAALMSAATLSGQQTTGTPSSDQTNTNTGTAAASSSNAGRSNNWQNWVFAGGALAAAIAGLFVVAVNTGQSATSH